MCMMGFIYVCVRKYIFVDFYEDVELYDGRKVGFYVLCLGTCVRYQRKMRLFLIDLIIRNCMKYM